METEKKVVSLIKYNPESGSLKKALDLCEGLAGLKSSESVLIKPNLVISGPPSQKPTGMVTSTTLMEELILILKENGLSDITIGDGSIQVKELGTSTATAMDWSGMSRLAAKYDVKTIDFNRGPFKEFEIDGVKIRVTRAPLETDFLINFPVLKTHAQTKVTLGIKNLKGCLSPGSKKIFHKQDLEKFIAFLGQQIKVDLTIIDGLYGLQKGPMGKDIHPMNLIIAGRDMVSVDMVGSAVIGTNPNEVNYLRYIAKSQGESLDLSRLDIRGERIEDVAKKLIWEYPWCEELLEKYSIRGIACEDPGNYFCSGCTVTAFAGLNRFFRENQGCRFKGVEICMGSNQAHEGSQKVFLVGKCSVNANPDVHGAIAIKGCPASTKEVYEKLSNHLA
ncbi:MAG: hypothetical protein B1H13_05900 [Desulfobacteraceae bacterium 4484_190.3]|nr:MAG: hypothetical protein B1H13_05900 [Desulfobacteraceae bacterium 4484_190.3]